MRIFISTGELSGELAGAGLAQSLKRKQPGIRLSGVGGKLMKAAGVELVEGIAAFGSVGLTESLSMGPQAWRSFRKISEHLRLTRPEAAILIGHEFFHLLLSRWLRRRGIATISYFPPQVWLWRRFAGPIASAFDLILTAFPEEEQVYRSAGGKVQHVGHYLADSHPAWDPPRPTAAKARTVGLFPGSRSQEVRKMLPLFLSVSRLLRQDLPGLRFAVAIADPRFTPFAEEQGQRSGLGPSLTLHQGSRQVLDHCDLALLTSGTATLETAFSQRPFVIAYRLSRTSYLASRLIKLFGWIKRDTIGLPNLLLGEERIPEYRQSRAVPATIAAAASRLLNDDAARRRMLEDLREACRIVGPPGASERAAERVLEFVRRKRAWAVPQCAHGRSHSKAAEGTAAGRNSSPPSDQLWEDESLSPDSAQ